MRQAETAGPVTKAAWTASDASRMGEDMTRALRLAASGRPGPVHLGLPVDVLDAVVEHPADARPQPEPADGSGGPVDDSTAEEILGALAAADRPIVIIGPALIRDSAVAVLAELAEATGSPVVPMESPRGANDPSLGAFVGVLREADLLVLLGKKLDFSLGFGSQVVRPECSFIQVDADPAVLEQARGTLGDSRSLLAANADPLATAARLVALAGGSRSQNAWRGEVTSAISYRPSEWAEMESPQEGPVHSAELARAIDELLDGQDAVFVSDGGEFGQGPGLHIRASPHHQRACGVDWHRHPLRDGVAVGVPGLARCRDPRRRHIRVPRDGVRHGGQV